MADDRERPVRGGDGRRQPEQIGLPQHESAGTVNAGIRCPENQPPAAEIDDAMAERLAKDRLVLGDREVVAIMVAAEMKAGGVDGPEGLRDLLLEPQIGRMIAIGNAIAEGRSRRRVARRRRSD